MPKTIIAVKHFALGGRKSLETAVKAQFHLLNDVMSSTWNSKKFTNFFYFVPFVGKEWCFIIWFNTAYYTTKVSVIDTESSICINLLK